MEINIDMKKVGKYVGAACAATGVVALSGLVASGAAVGAVVEGFRTAAATMKKMVQDETPEGVEIEAENETMDDVEIKAENEADSEQDAETSVIEEKSEENPEN